VAKTLLGLKVQYFGDYELIEEIGRGGMGIVFKARQVSLNRYVAVKILLHGELAGEEFVQRFHAEAEAAASLQHPNIVAIHEVGVHEGRHYFAMDYVEGQNLAELVRDAALPDAQAARYVRTLAETIDYAHQQGILHRDLTPSNILIDRFDQPRITDFGLAKRLTPHLGNGPLAPDLTTFGQVLGAPSYMPPEQAGGRRGEVGVASDLYALGAILYHLITGRPPFLADTLQETLLQVQNREPIPPRRLRQTISRDLETICLKCLRKKPAERYATAAALADDLRRWQSGEPVLARPLSRRERLWRACRRHPALGSLALATVSGILAAALVWPHPKPLHIPPGVNELIFLTDNSVAPDQACVTDPSGTFWHRLPIRSSVDVSPDGRRLCYQRQDGPSLTSIWISQLDGSGRRKIAAERCQPTWLDDQTLLCQALDHLSLWSVNINTKQTYKLFDWSALTPRGHSSEPRISPDGRHLLCNPQNGARAHTADVFVCNLDGSNKRVVWEDVENPADPDSGVADHCLLWLDNERVAWCRHAREGNRVPDMAIVTCRIGDTNLHPLTGWKGYNYPVAVSPDGKRLLYVTEDFPGLGQPELWIMNLDGTGATNLPGVLKGRKFSLGFGVTARWIRLGQ
jgi:serine/threonine protein kinase